MSSPRPVPVPTILGGEGRLEGAVLDVGANPGRVSAISTSTALESARGELVSVPFWSMASLALSVMVVELARGAR